MNPREHIEELQEKIHELFYQISWWEMIEEAKEQEKSPNRERIVVMLSLYRQEYVATHRYEINDSNGYATVQLKDGSILPTRKTHWCIYSKAQDMLGIDNMGKVTLD